jgi:hypothetical protein
LDTACTSKRTHSVSIIKGEGKVHPRTGHEGPEGKETYSSTLSLPSVLDWGWVVNAMPWQLYPPAYLTEKSHSSPYQTMVTTVWFHW